MVAHFQFPLSEIALARIVQPDAPAVRRAVCARFRDERHEPHVFRAAEGKAVVAGASLRINRENPPSRNAKVDEEIPQFCKGRQVSRMDAGNHIEQESSGVAMHKVGGHADCGGRARERFRVAPQKRMLRLQAVKVKTHARHSRRYKAFEPSRGERKPVRDDSPGVAPAHDFNARLLDVVSQKRLAARDADGKPGDSVRFDVVQRTQKIRERHIRNAGRFEAIASTVAAVQIAAQCAFPKQIVEPVPLDARIPVPPEHPVPKFAEEHNQFSECFKVSSASTLSESPSLLANSSIFSFVSQEPFFSPSMSSKMNVSLPRSDFGGSSISMS